MLMSMTGHGDARHQSNGCSASVEIRTVNSRYFKLAVRGQDSYASLESRIEALVRKQIRRGTVSLNLKIARETSGDDFRINSEVLTSYLHQLKSVGSEPSIESLLHMPGVVAEKSDTENQLDKDWEVVKPAVEKALDSLQAMRTAEGQAMADDMAENCKLIEKELAQIETKTPQTVAYFQQRLTDRINKLLQDHDVSVESSDVIREIGIFAERCDISEEVVRLKCHLEQFGKIASEKDSAGRKLDFLIQEMFRETNTIGSKCNDAGVAMHVVEIKTMIERMREMIQNVE